MLLQQFSTLFCDHCKNQNPFGRLWGNVGDPANKLVQTLS